MVETEVGTRSEFDFLWLEVTNQCNLKCRHCYSESGPEAGHTDVLSLNDYEALIDDAAALGCRKIQFIGGEPTLFRQLPTLLRRAQSQSFSFIEVFSNLTRLPEPLISALSETRSNVATSIYGFDETTHDAVTLQPGSFKKTVSNLKKLIAAGIEVRAGFIEMEQNAGAFDRTKHFLAGLGVVTVGWDRLRHFGRGNDGTDAACLSELCGSCSGNVLAIGADGRTAPCIMSKAWSTGSILQQSLGDIVKSVELAALRRDIWSATAEQWRQESHNTAQCGPQAPCFPCAPQAQCPPCRPNTNCNPNHCRPYCFPNP
jgi:MoaA/NifB/PqqE/SkfB family radical SAM enzyme